jgi:hypothetical protein
LVKTQLINSDFLLLALDVIIFLVLRSAWKSLPWERASQEIKQNMANRLQIIPTALFVTDVGVDRGIARSSCEVLSFSERNMLVVGVFVALCESEVNDIDIVLGALGTANQKVVGFNISVNNPFLVHFLNALDLPEIALLCWNLNRAYHLDCDVQNCLEVKFATAFLE